MNRPSESEQDQPYAPPRTLRAMTPHVEALEDKQLLATEYSLSAAFSSNGTLEEPYSAFARVGSEETPMQGPSDWQYQWWKALSHGTAKVLKSMNEQGHAADGIAYIPAQSVMMHPEQEFDAGVRWTSPAYGKARATINLKNESWAGNGWFHYQIIRTSSDAQGAIIKEGNILDWNRARVLDEVDAVTVQRGDTLSLVLESPGGGGPTDHRDDFAHVSFMVAFEELPDPVVVDTLMEAAEDARAAMNGALGRLTPQESASFSERATESFLTLQGWNKQLSARLRTLMDIAAPLQGDEVAVVHAHIAAAEQTIDDIRTLTDEARLLVEKTGADISDTSDVTASAIGRGVLVDRRMEQALDALTVMPDLGSRIETLLNERFVTSEVQMAGSALTTPQGATMPLRMPFLGGNPSLVAAHMGRSIDGTIRMPSTDFIQQMTRIRSGSGIATSALNPQLTWEAQPSLYEFSAMHPIMGRVRFSSSRRMEVNINHGTKIEPPQRVISTGNGGIRGQLANGKLNVEFEQAGYVQGLNIIISGSGQATQLSVTTEDGRVLRIPVTSSGVIPIAESIRSFQIDAGQGTNAELRSIDARSSIPQGPLHEIPEDAVEIRNSVAVIDLAASDSRTTRLTGRVHTLSGAQSFKAIAYRDEHEVGRMTIGPDGFFDMADAAGITNVTIQGGNGTFLLSSLEADGEQGASQLPTNVVLPGANAVVDRETGASVAAANWNTFMWRRAIGFGRVSSGPMRGRMYSNLGYYLDTDPAKYSLIKIEGATPQFQGLRYLSERGGYEPYPTDAYEARGHVLVIYPMANPVTLWMQFSGSNFYTSHTGDARTDIMPPLTASPSLGVVGRRSYRETGGWQEPIFEWNHRNEKDSFLGYFNLVNEGLSDITFQRIQVHVGSTGTAADPLTYTLNEPKHLLPGSIAGLTLPVAMQGQGYNQQWSVMGITNDNQQVVLRTGTIFYQPEPVGDDDRHLVHLALQQLSVAERMNLSPNAIALLQSVVDEYNETRSVSSALAARFTSEQEMTPYMRLALLMHEQEEGLRTDLIDRYLADGDDLALATTRAEYTMKLMVFNPHIYAEKYGIEGFSWTQGDLAAFLGKVRDKVKTETQVVLGSSSNPSAYDAEVEWIEEAAEDIGGGGIVDGPLNFLRRRLGLEQSEAERAMNEANTIQTNEQAWEYLEQALHLSNAVPSFHVRTDTIASQIYMGLFRHLRLYAPIMQQGETIGNDSRFLEYIRTAKAAEMLTGIAWWKIMMKANAHQSFPDAQAAEQGIAERLKDLFVFGHYDHLFSTVNTPTTEAKVLFVEDATDYGSNPGYRRLRFDLQIPEGLKVHHMRPYVLENGIRTEYFNEQTGQNELTEELANQNGMTLYINIPTSRLREIASKPYENMSVPPRQIGVRLALWLALDIPNTTTPPIEPAKYDDMDTVWEVDVRRNLSLSADPETQKFESAVLNIVADAFPLKNPASWHVGLGSQMHQGSSFNSLDLNLLTEDRGKPAYASAPGVVIRNRPDSSQNTTVVIRHEIEIDGQMKYWYASYLHMQEIRLTKADGSVAELTEGTLVETGDQIGEVGNEGISSSGPHLHFEVSLNNYGQGRNIELQRLIEELNIGVTATSIPTDGGLFQNGPTQRVVWSEADQEWITGSRVNNSSQLGGNWLMYDRSVQENGQTGGSPTYWIGWNVDPGLRKRVVYISKLPNGTIINGWLQSDNYSQLWDPSSRTFITR